MNVITIKRTIRRNRKEKSNTRRSFWKLSRDYFTRENSQHFIIEAVLFAILTAISAWPLAVAVDVLRQLLERSPG
jgi:hypothetical protein